MKVCVKCAQKTAQLYIIKIVVYFAQNFAVPNRCATVGEYIFTEISDLVYPLDTLRETGSRMVILCPDFRAYRTVAAVPPRRSPL